MRRGVGILDIFMMVIVLFLLVLLVIVVGLLEGSNAASFSVSIDSELRLFELAQYARPVHSVLSIEQGASRTSVAEAWDRQDGDPGNPIPPQVIGVLPTAIQFPGGSSTQVVLEVTIDSEENVRTIRPQHRPGVSMPMQIDEDTRLRIAPNTQSQSYGAGVIAYALE